MDAINFKWIVVDGLLLSIGLSVALLVALSRNPRIMLPSYPAEIRDKAAPLTRAEKRQRLTLVLVIIILFVGVISHFVGQLRFEADGGVSVPLLFVNLYLLFLVFNVFDLVVLDLFLLTVLKPRSLFIAEIEGFTDRQAVRHHVRGFAKGMVIMLVLSAVATLVAQIGV